MRIYLPGFVGSGRNPFEVKEYDKFLERNSRKSLSTLNNHLLLNSGNILDNSIINLRPCNNSINQINTSNKGYYKANNCDRYIAVCNIGTKKYIGSFKTEEDAHNAYLEYRSIFIT